MASRIWDVRLCLLVLLAAGMVHRGSLQGTESEPRAKTRPNFLFIYTDDQRWDAMGVVQKEQGDKARFPWFKTPNLDRLAAQGIRYRNAFVVSSLCSPSRAAFLTGRYNHFNGVANNSTPFPVDAVTWPRLLMEAGYTTGYVGKWHMGQQKGKRPGFAYSASFVGQGKYLDCPFEVNGVSAPTKGWVDDVSTDYAINFLREYKKQPFALIVGFKSAHGPFQPPERLAEKYQGVAAKPALNEDSPAPYRGKFDGGNPKAKAKKAKAPLNAAQDGPRKLQGYFGCLAGVDENVGKLLAALDELKLAEDTVVVFTSDNGFYLGEHGLADKRSAYDESIRIPLMMRYPKLGSEGRAHTIDSMVLNIDIAPTFLDLAGVPIPKEMQGKSMVPLLRSETSTATATALSWRKSFLYEYFYERYFAIPSVLAVRTDKAKLIHYPGHPEWSEMFNLAFDPYETNNLYSKVNYQELRLVLERELERLKKETGYQVPEYAHEVPAEN